MASNLKMKSVSMIILMFLSVMLSVISVPVVSAAAINQTTEGTDVAKTWTNAHTLTVMFCIPGAS